MSSFDWFEVEVCAYILGRPATLESNGRSTALDLERWIEATEITWLPSTTDLHSRCEAFLLAHPDLGWPAVVSCLREAGQSYAASVRADPWLNATGNTLAARRRVPESTLLAFAGGNINQVPVSYPSDVTEVLANGCSDIHVHQGASVGFDSIIRESALALKDLGELSWPEVSQIKLVLDQDTEFEAELLALPLIAGMAISVARRGEDLVRLGPTVLSACRGDLDAWASIRDELIECVAGLEGAWADDPEQHKRDMDDTSSRRALLLYLTFETLLYRGISQSAQGLDRFVAAFDRFSRLRKAPKIGKERYLSLLTRSALEATPGLRHIDLRLGERITGSGAGASVDDLLILYAGFARAYAAQQQSIADAPTMRFPLGLIKDEPVAGANWRWDTRALWDTLSSFRQLLTTQPALWALADGVDVCGQEDLIPNWLIVPALSEFSRGAAAAGAGVSLRFHAGEWQWNPVHGLRRISEALEVDRAGFRNMRIGHGLALDSDDYSRLDQQPIDELLDDLVFCCASTVDLSSGLSSRVERAVWKLLRAYAGPDGDWIATRGIEFLARAYRARMDPNVLERISNVGCFDGTYAFIDGRPTPAIQSLDDVVTLHMSGNRPRHTMNDVGFTKRDQLTIEGVLADCYAIVRREIATRLTNIDATVEVCPTSNAIIGSFRGMDRHPVRKMRELSVAVAVGTDDPSIFRSWLADEYAMLHSGLSLGRSELNLLRERGMTLHIAGDTSSEIALAYATL